MSLKADSKTVNEVEVDSYDRRFICNSDFSQYSVELVVQVDDGEEQGVLTVWNDQEMLTNNTVVEVDLDDVSVRGVANWFDNFLLGCVNQYLK